MAEGSDQTGWVTQGLSGVVLTDPFTDTISALK